MPEPTDQDEHRSGFVAMIGPPNAGKSTLLNVLVGQTLAPVASRPQTTIRSLLGIVTLPRAQIIFVDTPGIHRPIHRLGEHMVMAAHGAFREADSVLAVFDTSRPLNPDDGLTAEMLLRAKQPCLTAANKIDLVAQDDLPPRLMALQELVGQRWLIPLSAQTGLGVPHLVDALIAVLPAGPPLFDADAVSMTYERDLAADMIRAACLEQLRDEVPYQTAVRIDSYRERQDGHASIDATLLVEKESQKAIVIGKGGQMIRAIGTDARSRIEQMTGHSVYLALHVKEMPGWRGHAAMLRELGYAETGS
jgi:GTP-binding protein Era